MWQGWICRGKIGSCGWSLSETLDREWMDFYLRRCDERSKIIRVFVVVVDVATLKSYFPDRTSNLGSRYTVAGHATNFALRMAWEIMTPPLSNESIFSQTMWANPAFDTVICSQHWCWAEKKLNPTQLILPATKLANSNSLSRANLQILSKRIQSCCGHLLLCQEARHRSA